MRKDLLVRFVAMLTRMIERGTQVREGEAVYGYGYWYGNENGNDGASGQPNTHGIMTNDKACLICAEGRRGAESRKPDTR